MFGDQAEGLWYFDDGITREEGTLIQFVFEDGVLWATTLKRGNLHLTRTIKTVSVCGSKATHG